MTDQQQQEGEPEGTAAEPRHDAHLIQARSERDKAKAEAKELRAKLTEFEKAQRTAAEAKEREAGDFKAIEARYQTQIRDLQEQLEARSAELEGLHRGTRQRGFVDAIMGEAGVTNRVLVEALLPRLGLDDDAPAEFTKRDVTEAVKALRSKAPEMFQGTNNPKPPPGSGQREPDRSSPEYWRDRGRRATEGGTNPAYAAATGRGKG